MQAPSNTNSMYEDVVEFHQQILGVEPELFPTFRDPDWVQERYDFMQEELEEFITGAIREDMVDAVDGLLDLIYVALGTLYMMGIKMPDVWDVVHAANMRKVRGTTKRGNKIDAAKPEGWVGPEDELRRILGSTNHS